MAFVGRSNCGKSTLLNALLGRKGLARASRTPGRTAMVNFFAIDYTADEVKQRLIMADLPGYGFSSVGREVRRHWEELVGAYLGRKQLRKILFLVDSRRFGEDRDGEPGLAPEDLELLARLSRGHAPVSLILTKCDKLSRPQVKRALDSLTADLEAQGLGPFATFTVSSVKGDGLGPLREALLPEAVRRVTSGRS